MKKIAVLLLCIFLPFSSRYYGLSPGGVRSIWLRNDLKMYDVDWDKEGISSRKLEYIAYKFGFFHEGHRAINDCLARVHRLAQQLPNLQEPVLKELLVQPAAIRFKLYAVNSPYDSKEPLKARGYRWSMNQNDKYRAWSIELTEDKVAEEINYLRSNIYNTSSINIPVEILDTHS